MSDVRVSFQGERGAYSELAVRRFFAAATVDVVPKRRFQDAFEAVLTGEVQYGVLPIENALTGSIHENYDLLLTYPGLKIAGEVTIRINHALIGVPGATIADLRRVFSHPQGLAQCARFLDQHEAWERVPYYDTAGSVAHIAQLADPANAAIANAGAADYYGMAVLHSAIETNPRNYTRFVVLAPQATPTPGVTTKASLVFSVPDKPGALLVCMKALADLGINLHKIESRPIHGKPWQYMFYVDIEVPAGGSAAIAAVPAALRAHTDDLRLLGVYRVDDESAAAATG